MTVKWIHPSVRRCNKNKKVHSKKKQKWEKHFAESKFPQTYPISIAFRNKSLLQPHQTKLSLSHTFGEAIPLATRVEEKPSLGHWTWSYQPNPFRVRVGQRSSLLHSWGSSGAMQGAKAEGPGQAQCSCARKPPPTSKHKPPRNLLPPRSRAWGKSELNALPTPNATSLPRAAAGFQSPTPAATRPSASPGPSSAQSPTNTPDPTTRKNRNQRPKREPMWIKITFLSLPIPTRPRKTLSCWPVAGLRRTDPRRWLVDFGVLPLRSKKRTFQTRNPPPRNRKRTPNWGFSEQKLPHLPPNKKRLRNYHLTKTELKLCLQLHPALLYSLGANRNRREPDTELSLW